MATSSIPALDAKVPMVEIDTGRPSPQFQRMWQNMRFTAESGGSAGVNINGKVDKFVSTGWSSTTGISTKATYTVYVAPVIAGAYSQAQVQALADQVQKMDQRLKAVVDGLIAASVFG